MYKRQFIDNESGKWIKVLNPSTEEVISLMPDGTVEDARKAIDAAEKAQNQWERTPSIERAAYLTKIAAGIRKREKELTDIIVREGGKTQGLANVEVLFTADYMDYMAGWARRYEGEIIPSDRPHENIFLFTVSFVSAKYSLLSECPRTTYFTPASTNIFGEISPV